MPWTLCFSTKVTSSSVLKSSGEFEPTTERKAGEFVSLLEDDIFSFFLKLFFCMMPRVHILFSQLQRQTINLVFVWEIMQQLTQFFWCQRTLFHISNSRPLNYGEKTSSAEGSMPLQGPYCFWKDSVLGPEQGTCKDPIVFERILY